MNKTEWQNRSALPPGYQAGGRGGRTGAEQGGEAGAIIIVGQPIPHR
jgi:hypothetical protein